MTQIWTGSSRFLKFTALTTHIQHTSNTHPTHIQHTSNTHPTQIQHTSNTNPTHIQHTSNTHPTQIQHTSNTNPTHIRIRILHRLNRRSVSKWHLRFGNPLRNFVLWSMILEPTFSSFRTWLCRSSGHLSLYVHDFCICLMPFPQTQTEVCCDHFTAVNLSPWWLNTISDLR